MHQKSHVHEFLIHYFHNKELDEFYISVLLKNFGASLISIFIPIYLLQLGYGLQAIALFFIVNFLSAPMFFYFGTMMLSKIGVKKTMSVGTLILMIAFLLVNDIGAGVNYLFAALIYSLAGGIYYAGFHCEFSQVSIKNEEGRELSVIKAIVILVSALAPLTGALIIAKQSFSTTFTVASILLIISIIPLFFSKDFKVDTSGLKIKNIAKEDNRNKGLIYQASGALFVVNSILWPTFIYLILTNILDLGIIISISSVLMVFFILYVGKLTDKNKEKTLEVGVVSHSASWVIRLLLLSPVGLFFGNFLSSATSSLIDIPFGKLIYQKAKHSKKIAAYFLFREGHLAIGRVAILLVTLITGSLLWTFIVSIALSFIYFLPTEQRKRHRNNI